MQRKSAALAEIGGLCGHIGRVVLIRLALARCLSVYTPPSAEVADMVEAELMVDFLLSFSLYAIVCRMLVVSTDGNWSFTARLFKHKTHHLVLAVTKHSHRRLT